MPTRIEVIQGLRARDEFQNRDIALILDYLEQEASSSSSTRASILNSRRRTQDEVSRRDLAAIYNYLAELGTPASTIAGFLRSLARRRDIVSRKMVNLLMDEIDATSFVLLPPAFANMQHWWDQTDPNVVFADVAGTISASFGGLIERIDDKGFAGLNLTEVGAGVPTWTSPAGGVNGLSVASSGSGLGFFPGAVSIAGSPAGAAFATIQKIRSGVGTLASFAYDSAKQNLQAVVGTGWRVKLLGDTPFRSFGKAVVLGEWLWLYGTIDAAGTARIRAAGGSEVSFSGTYTPNAGGGTISYLGVPVDCGESMIWNKDLTPAETIQLISYFDSRYGVTPF